MGECPEGEWLWMIYYQKSENNSHGEIAGQELGSWPVLPFRPREFLGAVSSVCLEDCLPNAVIDGLLQYVCGCQRRWYVNLVDIHHL